MHWSLLSMVIVMGVAFCLTALPLYFVWIKIIGPMRASKRLLKTGLPGKAKILSVQDTRVTLNQNPRIHLSLEVRPEDRRLQTYTVEIKPVVSRLQVHYFQPGGMLSVRYDPKNPKQVAIEGAHVSPSKS